MFVVSILFVILFLKNKTKREIEKSLINYINNGIVNEYMYENALADLEYAKNDNVNYYNITDFINNYIDSARKSVKAKIDKRDETYNFYKEYNDADEIGYQYYELTFRNKQKKYDIIIYRLRTNALKYIIKHITDEDIISYNNGTFDQNIKLKLEKIFIHTKDDKWYIDSDEDEHIELPYNIYLDYVSNKKQNKNVCSEVINLKIKDKINEENSKKNKILICEITYKDFDGNIVKDTGGIGIKYDSSNNIKVNAQGMLGRLFYTFPKDVPVYNAATLTAGQHDYDEALIKEKEWEAEIGLNGDMSYLNVNGNIDKEEKETEHYLTDEEFEKVFKGINKKYGIE